MRPRAVTREQVLEGADRLARREGIDSLTVRSLCRELGVTAPAVYRHFPSKDDIVEEVVDRIIGRTELPGPEVGDWAERLRVCFVSVHDQVAPYAGLAARMGQEMPKGPSSERNGDFLDAVVADAGIAQADAAKIVFSLFVYTWGHLLARHSIDDATRARYGDVDSRDQFLWGLEHLIDSVRREFGRESRSRVSASRRATRFPPKTASARS